MTKKFSERRKDHILESFYSLELGDKLAKFDQKLHRNDTRFRQASADIVELENYLKETDIKFEFSYKNVSWHSFSKDEWTLCYVDDPEDWLKSVHRPLHKASSAEKIEVWGYLPDFVEALANTISA